MGKIRDIYRYVNSGLCAYDLLVTCIPLAGMCVVVYRTDVFKTVKTEIGFKYFAESAVLVEPLSMRIMPLNTIVNAVYWIVGFYWLCEASKHYSHNRITIRQFLFFRIFSWMAILYAPVQLSRTVFQTHELAVLDQWCTAPFFQWVVIWCWYTIFEIDLRLICSLEILSVASYFLTLSYENAFEVLLGVHIAAALISVLSVIYYDDEPSASIAHLSKGIFCCCGFVFFKVLDLQLKNLGFDYVSGHFLSKICDGMQIHYACKIFETVITRKSKIK